MVVLLTYVRPVMLILTRRSWSPASGDERHIFSSIAADARPVGKKLMLCASSAPVSTMINPLGAAEWACTTVPPELRTIHPCCHPPEDAQVVPLDEAHRVTL
ncbi:hypothetical protein D9M71_583270 [compost metagenome]